MKSSLPTLPPARVPPGFYRRAGKACALYVQNGGRLRDIRMEESQLLQVPLQLTPAPRGSRDFLPPRKELEEDLELLLACWCGEQGTPALSALRFLIAFCGEMERGFPGWRHWARVWVQRQREKFQLGVRDHYQQLLHPKTESKQDVVSCWDPHPEIQPESLLTFLEEKLTENGAPIHHSSRAVVLQCDLLGLPVIIKRYVPNPSSLKRRWETSRARRAYAAARTLQDLNLPGIQGLGWLECHQQGELKESYFISRQLPQMETLRTWLRREYSNLSPSERSRFRHRLRAEMLRLQDQGLRHVDLKLSNLLVQGKQVEDLVFYWIDLEDLRDGPSNTRTFVRNLYQLNGSLPREISKKEREAFAAGFRHRFPIARSPSLYRFVQRKTRRRHLDELKRKQGA